MGIKGAFKKLGANAKRRNKITARRFKNTVNKGKKIGRKAGKTVVTVGRKARKSYIKASAEKKKAQKSLTKAKRQVKNTKATVNRMR